MKRYKSKFESIEIPLEKGDSFRYGKFKNKTSIYKSHYFDDKGDLVIITDTDAEIKGCKIRLIKESIDVKFNFKDLGRDDWNKILKDPDFGIKIEYMSPKEFLDRSDYKRFNYDAEKILKIKNSIDKNTTLPIPSLWFDSEWHKNSKHKSSFHDGQHRVLALQELGIEKIPVMLVWNKESKLNEERFTPFKAWYFPDKDEFIKFSPHKDHREFVDNQMIALRSGAVRIYAFDNEVEVETRNLPDNSLYVKVLKTLSKKISNFKQAIKHIDWFSAGDRKVFNLQEENKVEFFTRFVEDVRFSDLMKSQSMSNFTKKFAKETNTLMGNATNHIKLIQMKYSKKKDFVLFLFVTERTPKYKDNFHLQIADPKKNFKLKKDNLYTIQIKILNFFSLLETTPDKITNKDIEDVFNVASVQIYSDVPFFHWGGCNWALSLLNGSIYPTNIAPKFWQKYTNNDSFLDKHSANLVNSIKFYIPQMRQMIHKIAMKK